VLAMVAFWPGQAKQALLEDGVTLVPQRNRKTQSAAVVADAQQAIFAPAVRPRTSVIVRKGPPRVAAGGIVLTHGAPLPFGQVRAPAPPGRMVGVNRGLAAP